MGAPQSCCCNIRGADANRIGGPAAHPYQVSKRTISAQCQAAKSAAAAGWHPVVAASPEFSTCITMIKAQSLRGLPLPWPRSQDQPGEHFKHPTSNDFAVAVSHGWPYQAHPDPLGTKADQVKFLLEEARQVHNPVGDTVCFYDFCSVTQRPFCEGQAERTDEHEQKFQAALQCMPRIYLLVDAVLHVEMPWAAVPGDCEVVHVDAADLDTATLAQVGPQVQVFSHGHPKVRLFDIVCSCGGKGQLCVADIKRMRNEAKSEGRACPVELRRSPFGNRNETPAGERGWVYLERFVSMVKVAMVDESEIERVCFSNSAAVLEQIKVGGARLRKAAQAGGDHLVKELAFFYKELDQKTFAGGSTDKVSGVVLPGIGSKGDLSARLPPTDREVVAAIMQEMVHTLPALWSEETGRQRQRQLTLAVNRGDAVAVQDLLSAAADANYPGERGATCLHKAALYNGIDIARLLIEHGGDVSIQDADGNCPAHQMYLARSEYIVDFFRLLAPTPSLLVLENSRGITPVDRFRSWALVANDNQPFLPAQGFLNQLFSSFPALRQGSVKVDRGKSARRAGVVHHQSKEYAVCGSAVLVEEWSSTSTVAAVDVLWISCGARVPPSLQVCALEYFARHICEHWSARLLFLRSVGRLFQDASLSDFQEKLHRVIEALSLQNTFVLVIDFCALAIPMLVNLRPHLRGLLLLNIAGCMPEEVLSNKTWQAARASFLQTVQAWQQRDFQILAKQYVAACVYVSDLREAARLEEAWRLALEAEGEDYWDYMAWDINATMGGEITRTMNSLLQSGPAARLDGLPAVLGCGACAPEVMFVQSMQRLRGLLPGSVMSYIPNSRVAFQLEGPGQLDAVADMLEELLRSLAPTRLEEAGAGLAPASPSVMLPRSALQAFTAH